MKKHYLLVLVAALWLLPTTAQAQFAVKPGVKIGLIGANMDDDLNDAGDEAELDGRTGILAGAFLLIDLPGPFALQPEVFYAQKGTSVNGFGTTLLKLNVNYIDVPVLIKYQFGPSKLTRPTLFAGPSFSFKMSESLNGEDLDLFKSSDVSVILGAGIDVGVPGGGMLTFDLRLVQGLSNVLTEDGELEGSLYNEGLTLSAGYAF